MIRKFAVVVASVLLGGCAQTYILEGQTYNSKEALFLAGNKMNYDAVSQIQPLPQPLTAKKLIIAIPSDRAIYEAGVNYATKIDGRAPSGQEAEILKTVITSNYNMTKVFYDAVERKRVYSSVSFRSMNSVLVNLEPSADTDVLFLSMPDPGSVQWFYSSQKYGKQVFAFDRSGAGVTAKVNAFVDAVQAQAIRE